MNTDKHGWDDDAEAAARSSSAAFNLCSSVFIGGLLALGASAVNLTGCAASESSRTNSPTGGLELSMFVRDETGAEELYRENRDGTLSFGGGFDARLDKTTWTGPMTPQEIGELRKLMTEHRWFETNPTSTNVPAEMRYRVTINAPETRQRFKVKGENPTVRPVRELLHRIALRRLEGELARLPQPSLQREATTAPATRPE